ncbi:PAS domain S-box protein [Roseomonas sp. SSH11]|uniref:histidine kinase n=1 Tax=Pararoseomonas baculiformis TaxID=2820812 RepID=A0ABS4AC87_9PROT|nr:PAS domain S-box protein [Pararoseomonas baculiformis]MBP0444627.1 PAS domain S-box protein [Pararoseomonas baculiformis]
MPDLDRMVKRQQVLADFGELALCSLDLDRILAEACRLVGDALGTGRAKLLEILHAEGQLLVRAGVGWDPGIVGRLRMPMEEHSSETFAIAAGEPVISRDIGKEDRFDVPPFMREAGVVALVNVPIFLPGGRAFGLLQVDDTRPRDFGEDEIQFLRTYANILGPVIDRLLLARTLQSTEERFRLMVESALDYAIFLADPQDRITDWLPGAQAVFGWTAEEVGGQPAAITFTPEDRASGQDRWETETARKEGVAPNIRWHIRKDGSRVFIEGSTRALRDPDGTLMGFLKIGQDVTARRDGEERLRESEERFRQFSEASSDLIWVRNAGSMELEYLSPAFETIYGGSREAVLKGGTVQRWAELVHPEDRERALSMIYRVRAGERVMNAFRIIRPSDGETRWIENTDFPLFDNKGRVQRIAGLAKDVTEARMSSARLQVLVEELQHRSRNLIGVITSVASRTLGEEGGAADFQARLQALSRAQGLLSQFGSDTAEVGALVRGELEAHTEVRPPKVAVSGPRVLLTARQVQNFSLALHELTTNAVKYGALRDEAGQLSVTWAVDWDEKGQRRLTLDWIESGVDLQPDRITRRGYGRQLIEKALAYALRARTEFVLGEDGVRCRIQLPLE